MKLSVIIVSYNVKHYIEQCIRSVWASAEAGGIETEVFVVDNASSDGSIDYLRQQFPADEYPTLRLIANSRNVGFGRANNQAARQAGGEYILFLNPDTLLTEQTLARSIGFADSHDDLGGIGVKMLKPDGSFAFESRRGLPTPWTAFCKMSGLAAAFPRSRTFGRYYMRYLDEDSTERIEIISGAFLLARKATLDACGLFDEDFFMYGEDIDLSYRMLLAGRHNYYVPAPILHYKGESTQKSSYRYVHVFYEAMLIFFKKHYRHYRWGLALPIKTAIYFRAFIALVTQQTQALSQFLSLGKQQADDRFLFIGRKENIATARQIADRWRLDLRYVEADEQQLPEGHLAPQIKAADRDFVIYDLDAYSRERVLERFAASDHRHSMGTFSSANRTIITAAATYGL